MVDAIGHADRTQLANPIGQVNLQLDSAAMAGRFEESGQGCHAYGFPCIAASSAQSENTTGSVLRQQR
jgi:hypothetical protein